MDLIGSNLQAVKQRIANAALACGRNPADIGLVAVSKTFGPSAVAAAHAHGQCEFGESYVQEAVEKIAVLAHLARKGGESAPAGPLVWHFIGPIQSNKTRVLAESFAWVHSVDRLKIAERLSSARPTELPRLQVCIQVNIGGENTKGGIAPDQALELARAILKLPRVKLRGLMTIPPASDDRAHQRRYFAQLRQIKDELTDAGIALDTLSMGMSDDLEAAIIEGATLVRLGTAIFGQRPKA